ncbi:MAG TPA: hypothetical protein VNF29_05040 [Candidatus Binataceae bacterium]|nr:hypothetical protein [Candidatus Binataceae bacterium]
MPRRYFGGFALARSARIAAEISARDIPAKRACADALPAAVVNSVRSDFFSFRMRRRPSATALAFLRFRMVSQYIKNHESSLVRCY